MQHDVLEKTMKDITSEASSNTIGLLAGGGDLPKEIIDACNTDKQKVYVLAFEGEADKFAISHAPHEWVGIGQVGKWIKILKKKGIKDIVLAGKVKRPSIADLKLDFSGARLLSRILSNKYQGDNALFMTIIHFLEQSGFNILGIDKAFKSLLTPYGLLTENKPDQSAIDDIFTGVKAAKLLGQADIGQAVVTQRGVILGVEAVEGTDALIQRTNSLRDKSTKAPILIKMTKPKQDTRIDLPTIGITTVENAHKNGIRGLALESKGTLIVNKNAVITRANQLGIFIVGIDEYGRFENIDD